jgi:hypothetical protein
VPTLETYRKQAKLLLRWHRDSDYSIGGKIRQLERYRALTDRDALNLKFTLAVAQEIVAVEAGHRTWVELKAAAAGAAKTPRLSPGPARGEGRDTNFVCARRHRQRQVLP